MAKAITNFGRSGLYDWLLQRVTSVVIGAYTLFLVIYMVSTPDISYDTWKGMFEHFWMRLFSSMALASICIHAWIGLWATLTDYITHKLIGKHATKIRVLLQITLAIINAFYFVWGITIVWG